MLGGQPDVGVCSFWGCHCCLSIHAGTSKQISVLLPVDSSWSLWQHQVDLEWPWTVVTWSDVVLPFGFAGIPVLGAWSEPHVKDLAFCPSPTQRNHRDQAGTSSRMLDWWASRNEDFLCHGCPEPSVSRKRLVLGLWSELSSLHPPLPVCGSRGGRDGFSRLFGDHADW